MNILITGGLGVNGCWVTRLLVEQGHRPIILDQRNDVTLLPDLTNRFELVVGDLLDQQLIRETLIEHRVQRICHLAAIYPEAADADPVLGFEVNALGTVYLLEAARAASVERVVFTSSIAALSRIDGDAGSESPFLIDESHPAYPSHGGVYGATKVASELMGQVYERLHDLEFVALRFSGIFGPGKGQSRHGNYGLKWTQLVENAFAGLPSKVALDVDRPQDMIYARDVARAVVLAVTAPSNRLISRVFHIGSGRGYTMRDFVNGVRRAIPEAVIEEDEKLDGHGVASPSTLLTARKRPSFVFDINRARAELGYEPHFTMETAIQDWVESLHWMESPPVK